VRIESKLGKSENKLVKTNHGDLIIVTWNCNGIYSRGRELELSLLLGETGADVAILTETEIPAGHAMFAVSGYSTFAPRSTGKMRMIVLVSNEVATLSNAKLESELLSDEFPSVWVRLGAYRVRGDGRVTLRWAVLIGGAYRQWSDKDRPLPAARERAQLDLFLAQVEAATESAKSVIFAGDLNLDSHRTTDSSYAKQTLSLRYMEAMEATGLYYHPTPSTFRSYGQHVDNTGLTGHRFSCLDHVFSTGTIPLSSSPLTRARITDPWLPPSPPAAPRQTDLK
jgi:exonuclease III